MGYEVLLLIDEVSWLTFVDAYVALDRSMRTQMSGSASLRLSRT